MAANGDGGAWAASPVRVIMKSKIRQRSARTLGIASPFVNSREVAFYALLGGRQPVWSSKPVGWIRGRYFEPVKTSLGRAAFETARAEGRAMQLVQAAALARQR